MISIQKSALQFRRLIGFISLFLLLSVACKKEKTENIPKVLTVSVTEITSNTAKVSIKVTADGGATVTGTGVCWGISLNPDLTNNVSNVGGGLGDFIAILNTLQLNTIYHVRAFATNNAGTAYGADLSFTTQYQ
ncbi:MAG: hypothetical protein WCO13_09215 [Bacteroidota bacterium]